MSYQKLLIDNPTCSRRYHITYDDQAPKVAKTEVSCSYCGKTVFSATDHPPVILARDENLTKNTLLSEHQVTGCNMVDKMTGKPVYAKSSTVQPT